VALHRRLLVGLTVLAACRSKTRVDPHDPCEAETRKDAFAVGLHKHGVANAFDFAVVSTNPALPARGDNTWVVQVNASGAPVAGATVTVTPFMPDHSHGTPIKVGVVATPSAGQYQLAPINLWMPGYWEITIHAAQGSVEDSAVFKLCLAN
jgi:hypothetical protein